MTFLIFQFTSSPLAKCQPKCLRINPSRGCARINHIQRFPAMTNRIKSESSTRFYRVRAHFARPFLSVIRVVMHIRLPMYKLHNPILCISGFFVVVGAVVCRDVYFMSFFMQLVERDWILMMCTTRYT